MGFGTDFGTAATVVLAGPVGWHLDGPGDVPMSRLTSTLLILRVLPRWT